MKKRVNRHRQKREKESNRAGHFRQVSKEDCGSGFRAKTIQDSATTAALKYLQAKKKKKSWQKEENIGGDAASHRQSSFWSGEKLFTVEAVVNYKNSRIYATSSGHIPEGVRTHFKR